MLEHEARDKMKKRGDKWECKGKVTKRKKKKKKRVNEFSEDREIVDWAVVSYNQSDWLPTLKWCILSLVISASQGCRLD